MKKIKLVWKFVKGIPNIQADLTIAGDYTISHRPEQFNVSFRPTGVHHHVGCYKTVAMAKAMAESHYRYMFTYAGYYVVNATPGFQAFRAGRMNVFADTLEEIKRKLREIEKGGE